MSEERDERRKAAERRTRRDLERLAARRSGDGFWSALRVMGSIGWPVALLTLLGAAVGRAIGGSPWHTAGLIALGATVGGVVAVSGLSRRAP